MSICPADRNELDARIAEALQDFPDNDELRAAVVTEASAKKVVAMLQNGETATITGDGLRPAASALSPKANPKTQIRPGAVVRLVRGAKGDWSITQLPEVEGAFVAMDPRTGSIRAMVGGFDYSKSKFNHVTQAWRQPGSSFKPFIYSAALEKGFTPATVINDAPLFFDAGTTGSQPWEPKNYDGTYDGPMTMRKGLAKSKNMISIRILKAIGPAYAQQWIKRFGFDADKHPAYLPMALGAGAVTPLQMASAYSVFANGGYRVNPLLISRITDSKGHVINEARVPTLDESVRTIDARNAFVMTSLLQEVTHGRHRSQGAGGAQAARHLRQDRHHQRLARRLVRGLAEEHRRRRLDGLRRAAQARRPRDGRRPVAAGLDRLHEHHAEGRAGAGAEPARRRRQHRTASGTTRNTRAAPA